MQNEKYKIGELAKLLDIKQFVVRFWEKEFNIKPNRSHGGHRFYTQEHLKKFNLIKKLLYEKKFTLEGAKKELKKPIEEDNIIPSQKTTIEKAYENNLKTLENNITQLKVQLLKLKELL